MQGNLNITVLNRVWVILNLSLGWYLSPVAEADCYCLDLTDKGTEIKEEAKSAAKKGREKAEKVQRIRTGLEATGWEGDRENGSVQQVLVTLRFRGGSDFPLSRFSGSPGCSPLVHLTCT